MPHIRFSPNEFLHTNGRIISVSLHFFNGLSGSLYFVNNIQAIETFFLIKRFADTFEDEGNPGRF
jgi:hypothetical protein